MVSNRELSLDSQQFLVSFNISMNFPQEDCNKHISSIKMTKQCHYSPYLSSGIEIRILLNQKASNM